MSIPSQRNYDKEHLDNLRKYSSRVKKAYLAAINSVAKLAVPLSLNANDEFYFRNYSDVNTAVNNIVKELYSNVYGQTVTGINTEWDLAVEKNNELTKYVYGTKLADLPSEYRNKYLSSNDAARKAFIKRKTDGLNLSDRVWNNSKQFKTELELALELSIGKGQSAANMSRNIRQYLNEPNKLFRRVRNANGELRLSKAAASYHPGQGVYRSSYKNALRVTANETNFSYEVSQQEKRNDQDFVVGTKIKTTGGHKASDDKGGISCISLQGNYPKNFDWSSKWHVNCKCTSLSILKTREELDADLDKILAGERPNTASKNEVSGVPSNYTKYMKDNSKKWEKWKSEPSFIGANDGIRTVRKYPVVKKPIVKSQIISKNLPTELQQGSDYLKGTDIVFKNEFFDLIDENRPIKLKVSKNFEKSFYSHSDNTVNILNNNLGEWGKEATVYHEYGHAIDKQRGLRLDLTKRLSALKRELNKPSGATKNIASYDIEGNLVMSKKNISIIEDVNIRLLIKYRDIVGIRESELLSKGIVKSDIIEQITAVMDTIMSINSKFGFGHSKSYFKRRGSSEGEFIAHAFENAYAGNPMFKKYLPDLYEEMIELIKDLK